MKVKRFENSRLQSNTYLLYLEGESGVWIIDPGDVEPITNFLKEHNLLLKGILVTHSHFDHIYGINGLQEKLEGTLPIYASIRAVDGFLSTKLNGSYYAEIPFTVECDNLITVRGGDTIALWENVYAVVHETPGHNNDCLSFELPGNLFTGDALIPGVKVHIRSKNANKERAIESIKWIIGHFSKQIIINPGHKNSCKLEHINNIDYLK